MTTPIEKLMELARDQRRKHPARDPVPDGCQPVGSFHDLVVGKRYALWARDFGRDCNTWQTATVRRIRDDNKRPGMSVAVLVLGRGTAFIYEHSWQDRDRHRVMRYADDGAVGPQTAAKTESWATPAAVTIAAQSPSDPAATEQALDRLKTLRRAAKPISFALDPLRAHINQNEFLFNLYTRIQREEIAPYVVNSDGTQTPRMTPDEIAHCKAMWSSRVSVRVQASDHDAARRERERVVVDDDRWEV